MPRSEQRPPEPRTFAPGEVNDRLRSAQPCRIHDAEPAEPRRREETPPRPRPAA